MQQHIVEQKQVPKHAASSGAGFLFLPNKLNRAIVFGVSRCMQTNKLNFSIAFTYVCFFYVAIALE